MPTKKKPPAERELHRQVRALRQRVRELLQENRRAVVAHAALIQALKAIIPDPPPDAEGLVEVVRFLLEDRAAAVAKKLEALRERDEARAELALAIEGVPAALLPRPRSYRPCVACGSLLGQESQAGAPLPGALKAAEYVTECPVPPDHRARAIFTNIDETPVILAEAPQITEQRTRYMREVPRG